MLKGILFWRWAGGDPTIDLSSENEATTLGEPPFNYHMLRFICSSAIIVS